MLQCKNDFLHLWINLFSSFFNQTDKHSAEYFSHQSIFCKHIFVYLYRHRSFNDFCSTYAS